MTTSARILGGTLRDWRNEVPRASRTISDRAGLYLDLASRRRRAVLAARHALEAATPQACLNGSFHCAVRSSSAAEAPIASTGLSAA